MTIGTQINSVTVEGNGVTSEFAYPFLMPTASVAVVIYTDADGEQTTLSASQYTIAGINDPNGGTVTYPLSGGPIALGTTLTIARILPLVQTTSISNQGPTFASIEDALDFLTMLCQQIQGEYLRTIQLNIADIDPMPQLPPAAQRANQLLGFDGDGNPIVAQPSSALVSSAMQPVVSASTLVGAAAAMGVTTNFATIAALRANTVTATYCSVAGYYAGSDGGEGLFWKNASDTTSADNNGTIIVDGAGQRWYRQTDNADTSVKWFGAKCDGSTDDTSAIQDAIDWVASQSGGRVTFPAGETNITGTLAITDTGVQLVGAGMYATVLLFDNANADCITIEGDTSAYVYGNAVRDLTITGVSKTGGRAIYLTFAAYWMVERVYMNTVWDGIEVYIQNTGTIRNVTMAGVTDPSGYCIYYHAPGDGTYRSDELNLHDVVVNPLYSGAVGLLIDGWANTVNGWQFVALDVSVGIRVLNTSGSGSYFPTYGEFVNSVVDGASTRSVEINAGQVWRFTGCEIGNNSGTSGQGSADDYAFFVGPDTGASETSQVYCVNCNIGGSKQSAYNGAGHDVNLIGCTLYPGITTPNNTYPSVTIAAPGSDTIIMGCKNTYFGAPVTWSYGVQMDAGSFRTLVIGCNFNIGSQSAAINNNSGDSNTFANEYIGGPGGAGTGPVQNFPQYAADPASPVLGETYYNTGTNKLKTWDGATWNNLW